MATQRHSRIARDIGHLKRLFASRPRGRRAIIPCLAAVLEFTKYEQADVDVALHASDTRHRTGHVFSRLIQAADPEIDGRLRGKYAKVLEIASARGVKANHLEDFIDDNGGLNGVIEAFGPRRKPMRKATRPAKRRP